jgi:hypothetical protein
MRTLRAVLAAATLVAALGAAAEDKPAAGADPLAGWKPPGVKHEKKDRSELQAFFQRMEAASAKGDLEAAAALIDFPVLMVTDDSKGEAVGDPWSREQWVETMKPYYAQPSPPGTTTHGKPTIVLMSDSLALVGTPWTMKVGGKKVSGTSVEGEGDDRERMGRPAAGGSSGRRGEVS